MIGKAILFTTSAFFSIAILSPVLADERNEMGAYGEPYVASPSGTRHHDKLYIDEGGQVVAFFDVAVHINYEGALTGLSVQETVPNGWTFVSVSGDDPPDDKPSAGASDTLDFTWTTPPTSPVDFTYRLAVPDTASGDAHFTGEIVYRCDGNERRSTIGETVARGDEVTKAERKYLDGKSPSEFYVRDGDYEMPIRIEHLGTLTAIEVQDTPPTGWTFVSVGGPNPPDSTPNVGDTGTMSFSWATPPSSPVSFTYKVRVPAIEKGGKEFSGGKVLYRGTRSGQVPLAFEWVWRSSVLSVLVYNLNDIPAHPPGTTITISPIVGTISNWTYSYVLPDGTYTIGVSAPNFSPEHRTIELTNDTAEVFALAPDPGSVSGKVVSTNTSSSIRGASVQLEVTSGLHLGTTYDALTGTDGSFSLSDLPAAIKYQVTVSKTFYDNYQAGLTLNAGEAKDLGAISFGFTDGDDDGLPDKFERIIVDFDPEDEIDGIADVHSDDDFDNDGQTNGGECLAETDPISGSSCFRILSIVRDTPNAFTVTWTSVSGMLYNVYYGDVIGGWSLGASDIPASETGENSWTDDDTSGAIPPPGDASVRFYKVEAY